MKNSSGYTLTEMMMVISLAVVSMAVVGPSLVQAHQRYSVQSAADEFASAHTQTKLTAVQYGTTAELRIDLRKQTYWIQVDTGGTKPLRTFGRKWKQGTITANRSTLCFDMRGLPSTAGSCEAPDATVTFTNGPRSRSLHITALGVVRK